MCNVVHINVLDFDGFGVVPTKCFWSRCFVS